MFNYYLYLNTLKKNKKYIICSLYLSYYIIHVINLYICTTMYIVPLPLTNYIKLKLKM